MGGGVEGDGELEVMMVLLNASKWYSVPCDIDLITTLAS